MTGTAGSASSLSWRAGRSASAPISAEPVTLPMRDLDFRAMGCDCRIVVIGGTSDVLKAGEDRVRELEARWTRFESDSELNRFNDRAGHWTRVSPDLMQLLWRGLGGYQFSAGAFDPFMGVEISAAGYDRDFSELDVVPEGSSLKPTEVARRARHRSPIEVPLQIARKSLVARLAPGIAFDSGGIGKGLGADMVVKFLLSQGAAGALVSLGGDLRVGGAWPDDGWRISLRDPMVHNETSVKLRDGSVCTSGLTRRRWRNTDGSVGHHILDPVTGEPVAVGSTEAITVIARQGWRAEVIAKIALVGGAEAVRSVIARNPEVAALLWDHNGGYTQVS